MEEKKKNTSHNYATERLRAVRMFSKIGKDDAIDKFEKLYN